MVTRPVLLTVEDDPAVGGTIWFTTRPDGTTFTVRLPLASEVSR
jgi:signal transduction histidine kinase